MGQSSRCLRAFHVHANNAECKHSAGAAALRSKRNPPRLVRGNGVLDQMSEARLSSDLLQPASLMQAEKYSIFDAVSGGWNFQDGRNPENRNAFHAKTSILLLQVLKTPRLGARGSHQPPWRCGVLVFQGGLKPPKTRKKIVFFAAIFWSKFRLPAGTPKIDVFCVPGRLRRARDSYFEWIFRDFWDLAGCVSLHGGVTRFSDVFSSILPVPRLLLRFLPFCRIGLRTCILRMILRIRTLLRTLLCETFLCEWCPESHVFSTLFLKRKSFEKLSETRFSPIRLKFASWTPCWNPKLRS